MVVFLIKHSKCLKLNISLSFFLPSTPGFIKISPNSFKFMPEISITTEPEKQGWNWDFYWGMMTRIKIPYMHSWFPLPSDFSKSHVSIVAHSAATTGFSGLLLLDPSCHCILWSALMCLCSGPGKHLSRCLFLSSSFSGRDSCSESCCAVFWEQGLGPNTLIALSYQKHR